MKKYKIGDFVQVDPDYIKDYINKRWNSCIAYDNICMIVDNKADYCDNVIDKGKITDYYKCTLKIDDIYRHKKIAYTDLASIDDSIILCKINNLFDIKYQLGSNGTYNGYIKNGVLYDADSNEIVDTMKIMNNAVIYRSSKNKRFEKIEDTSPTTTEVKTIIDDIYDCLGE